MSPAGRVQTKEHDLNQDTLERVLELTDGENPVQYLDMDTPDTALGIIAWIDDPKRLAGWRLANQEFCNPPLAIITDALDKQQRALESNESLPVYHEPVHARACDPNRDEREPGRGDGPMRVGGSGPRRDGTTQPNRTRTDENAPQKPNQTVAEPETPKVHPRSRLQHGEVLVVDRGDRTEYITPNDADADEPYHSRLFDAEGDCKTQCDLSNADVERRFGPNCERTGADTIEIDLEATGATGVRA
ncbi:hypothetical protein [Halomontanus rarus]|uniref:hypothetical protein n=1 Tax=Halomontanus rarus TaxID=3034020 RepID=UPI00307C1508